ncbi:MAG TPA: hypothetical protein VLL54_09960 [Pyrinomonadaceae bacterium]|nr:hypothetical protein [Pyrinomonadaceae bacterium]
MNELVELFGTITNLILSIAVTAYGAFVWLKERQGGSRPRFSLLAYRCWWASWLCWVFAWGILLTVALAKSKPVPVGLKILVLVFDNLNSVFMILVYFVVTRGNEFNKQRIYTAFAQIFGALALGCGFLYMVSPLIDVNFAYEVHRTWSLCLGVFAPVLIGWACNLRYNTLIILVIGFAYGLMQPLVYATELPGVHVTISQANLTLLKPIVAMTLGGLKVLWAILFMQVLAHGATSSESLIVNKAPVHFHFFRRWKKAVLGHALVLGSVYCCLLITLVIIYIKLRTGLNDLATAFTIVCGFMALLDWFLKRWDRGNQRRGQPLGNNRWPGSFPNVRQPIAVITVERMSTRTRLEANDKEPEASPETSEKTGDRVRRR